MEKLYVLLLNYKSTCLKIALLFYVGILSQSVLGQAVGVAESCNAGSVTYRVNSRDNSDVFWFDGREGPMVASGFSFTTTDLTKQYYYSSIQTYGLPQVVSLFRFAKPDATFTVPQLNCVNTPVTMTGNTCQGNTFKSTSSSGVYSATGTFPTTKIDALTMQAWVKWDGQILGGVSQCIMLNGNSASSGYALYIDGASKKLAILLGGVALLKSEKILTTNKWQHVAIVRKDGVWTLYVDGENFTVTNETATPNVPGANGGGRFSIGKNNVQVDSFTGEIDEVAIWNRALNIKEVNDLRAAVCVSKQGSDGNWNFNEESGTLVNDVSPNGFNLSMTDGSARGAGTTYQWDFGDGSTVVTTNQKSVTHSYATRGRKTVTLTVTDFTNCPASTSQVISVAGTPSGITATATATDTEICKGDFIDVTATKIPFLVETDFVNSIEGWTLGPNWQRNTPWTGPIPNYRDNSVLSIVSASGKLNSSLQMPSFSTVGKKDVFVFVNHYLTNDDGLTITIEASADATNWTTLSTRSSDFFTTYREFATERLPLPMELENQANVYLRFRYNDNKGGNQWNIWIINSVKVGLASYTWSSTPAGTNTEEQVIPYIFPQETTTYSLLTTNGCDNQRSNVTVVVKPYPTATISGGGDACLNSKTSRISFKGSGATGPYTFKYAVLDDRGSRSEQTVTTTFGDTVSIQANTSALGNRYYDLLSVSTPTSCEALYTRTTVTVKVIDLPRAVINAKDFICPGDEGYIDISGASGSGPFTFSVSTPDYGVQAVNELSDYGIARVYFTSSSPGDKTFKVLSVRSANGCTYNYPAGQELTKTTTIRPAAVVNIMQTAATYCYDPVILTTTGTGNYTWTGEGLNKNTGDIVEARPEMTTVYKVTSKLGDCTATASTTIGVSKITLTGMPSASSYLVCPGSEVTLTGPKASLKLGPFFQENFDSDPFQRNWTKSKTLTGTVALEEEWRIGLDKTAFWNDVSPVDVGSSFVQALWSASNPGGVITHWLTSPVFSTLSRSKMTITLSDFANIIKSPKSAANVQLSSDGQNWTTISSITDQSTRLVSPTTRHIEIPAQFENKAQVWMRFEAVFENVGGSYDELFQWWAINNVSISVNVEAPWIWRQVFTNVDQTENPLIIQPTETTGYQATVKAEYGCTYTTFLPAINTKPVPVLTLGPVESIPVGREYASVPITTYSGFDKLSVLSSGAHPMPGFVTRNYENLTFLPPALPVAVPNVPAGTYDLIMRVTSSATGCSSDIPFQIIVGSSDSGLSGLTVDVAPPNWDGSPIIVSALIKSVVITATVSDPAATLKINGLPAVSGSATTVLLVSAGMIQIPVTVTAQDHTETTRMVSIRKLSNLDVMNQYIDAEAKVGYALRKLSTTYLHGAITKPGAVSGIDQADKPILRVRRSSDNALLDVGYDGTGALDTLTLLRFAHSGDAFVTIWYDQSGNDIDAFQSTLASQPRIVHGGVVERKNSLPTVYFNGGASQNVFLNTASFQGFNNQFSLYAVSGVKTDYQSNQNALASKTSGGYPAPFSISGGSFVTGNGTLNTDLTTLTTAFSSAAPFGVWSFRKESGAPPLMLAEFNNRFNVSGQTPITSNYADVGTPLVIGSDQQGQSRLNGWISELILLNQTGSHTQVGQNQIQTYLKPLILSFTPETATQLVIQGNNFSGATSVTIGSAELSFQIASDNKIIATVNSMASGMVSVTTPIGTGSKGFFYGPPPGNALRFEAPNAYVQIDNTLSTPDFTLETWMRTATNSAIGNDPYEGTVLLKAGERGVSNGFVLSMLNNKIAFLDGSANESTFGTISVVDGRWHHIAVVRKPGAYAQIYVDGVADGDGIVAGADALTGSPVIQLGANPSNPNFSFQGDMDELRIWQRALAAEDLKALMFNVPPKPYNSNLKNYYSFDVLTGDPTTELENLATPDRPGTLIDFDQSGNSWVESYAMVVPTAQPATNITSVGFTANWDAPIVGSLQTYILEVSKNPAFPREVDGYMELQAMPGHMLRGLDPGAVYYYRVFARRNNGDKQGGWSAAMKVTTLLGLELADLSLSHGSLEGGFSSQVPDYNSHVGADINDIQVTASTREVSVQMQIKINNGAYFGLTSNQASDPLPLVAGLNIISVKITADGVPDPRIYTITIDKAFSPPGNALRFNGVDDHITLDNTATGNFGTGDFTIELYMRTTQLSAGSILNKRDICNLTSYLDFIVSDGKMKFVSCTDNTGKDYKSLVGNAIVADGRWHHVAVTRSGPTITLYVDGKTDVTFTGTGVASISNAVAIKIGNNVCENRFAGSMDELRIWDLAKSQQELEMASWVPVSLPAPHLIAYYNFDTGVNDLRTSLENLTGSGNTATLQNGGSARWVESYAMVRPRIADASDVLRTGFTAKWNTSLTGFTESYVLQVSTSAAFDSFVEGYSGLTVTGKTSQDVTLPSTPNGRTEAISTYYYRVSTSKEGVEGQGTYSQIATVVIDPLPVKLISFSGKSIENKNLLEWKVADEEKFQGYEIERSVDGKNFEKIATVESKANNTSVATNYQFVDDMSAGGSGLTSGIFYYRLKMIDLDGSFAMSRIISIENDFGKTQVGSAYPNPLINRIVFVDIAVQQAGRWQTQVFSSAGILYSSGSVELQKGNNKITFDLENLPAGVHLIQFKKGAEHFLRKIVIN